jgi:hypothetical protein
MKMDAKRFSAMLIVMVAMGVILSGCASLVASGPKATPTPTAEVSEPPQPVSQAPDAVVETFYTWYVDYIGDRASGGMRNPLADGAYRSSEYLTEAFVQEVDALIASFDRGGYDPFLCAQDIPQDITVGEVNVSGDEAQVKVETNFEGHSFNVLLQREGDQWNIADVVCASPGDEGTVEIESLVDLARADLAQRLGVDLETVVIQGVKPTEFPDASLGAPESNKSYAQVVTPGCVIQLSVNDDIYVYHAAEGRAVLVSEEGESKKGTHQASPSARNEIAIGQSTLTFKMPTDWMQRGSEWTWLPVRGGEGRFGVNVEALEPPMEAEAGLLPKPAQIVASEPVELNWAQGARSFTVEVYGSAPQGGDEKAPVEAVQKHVLAIVQEDGQRMAIDLYVSAPSMHELAPLEVLLENVLRSAQLQ